MVVSDFYVHPRNFQMKPILTSDKHMFQMVRELNKTFAHVFFVDASKLVAPTIFQLTKGFP